MAAAQYCCERSCEGIVLVCAARSGKGTVLLGQVKSEAIRLILKGVKMKEFKVRLTFTEEVLGTCSNDPNIHEEFIASKAPDAMSREREHHTGKTKPSTDKSGSGL